MFPIKFTRHSDFPQVTKDELQTRPGKAPKPFRRMKDWEMSSGKKR